MTQVCLAGAYATPGMLLPPDRLEDRHHAGGLALALPHRNAAGRAGVSNVRWYKQYPARRIIAERGNIATDPLKPPL